MKKLEEIRLRCQESIDDYKELVDAGYESGSKMEAGRAELAEEILEILNGELK